MGGVRIAYLQCSSDLLDEIELCLIDWFRPPLNRQGIKRLRQTKGVRVRQIREIEVEGLGLRIQQQARAAIAGARSLDQICEEVGVSRTYWYDLESERIKGTLSIENLRKIEQALGADFGVKFND
jgi:transcriptional regulator with XRE-family HTH domain